MPVRAHVNDNKKTSKENKTFIQETNTHNSFPCTPPRFIRQAGLCASKDTYSQFSTNPNIFMSAIRFPFGFDVSNWGN